MAELSKEQIRERLFRLANELAGDETGHLAGIIHCVVSELQGNGADAFAMIGELSLQMELIRNLQRTIKDRG